METIVALAGRRIDAADAKPERFPERNLERVRSGITLALKEWRASWLVSSAAAGVDLIGIGVASELGIRCRIVVSPSVEGFRHSSVEDRGSYWGEEYTRLLAGVRAEDVILLPERASASETFRAINGRILSEAVALALSTLSKPICMAAWDGAKRDGEDFTADFIERATVLEIPVLEISTV